jgi:lipopolysaccharide export system ATP-binding protein
MFQGTSEELADNPIVREKYLGRDFKLKVKTRVDTVVNPNIEGFI